MITKKKNMNSSSSMTLCTNDQDQKTQSKEQNQIQHQKRTKRIRRRFPLIFTSLLLLLILLPAQQQQCKAFDDSSSSSSSSSSTKTLDLHEISSMRVRDIKRRLSRTHGYSNTELSKMLDKKELIHTLSYEEHKVFQKQQENQKRAKVKRGVIVALACVCVVLFWPLIVQVWDVASVNFVVYTDKKKYEISRCYELSSTLGYFGILLLFLLDLLQLWLTSSVILSWFIHKNKYFFPIPSLSIRPAALLAGATGGNAGPLGQYGLNIGPMVITWTLKFCKSKVESWLGKVFSKALKKQKKAKKKLQQQQEEWESMQEKEERKKQKALRKEERKKKREEEKLKQEEERKKQREKDVEEIKKRSEQSVVYSSSSAAAAADPKKQGTEDDEKKEHDGRDVGDKEQDGKNNEYYSQGEVPSWLNNNKNLNNDSKHDNEEEEEEEDVIGVGSGFDELD